ncbi:putative cytosine-specific methyltransferase [uncultured phage_Deep1-GF2-KM23-C739]|uniref:Putative cytosine-specific methyltransferase n=1 Tax=uncultured phage_Deep1-GF2-KM23-C739 TaxID=2740798 RepID=A0A1B1IW04_9CAUD|nr:putative cytosine-specific methyltransferase [uncultured phage_Deep1-GF2-KM23-C739]ANS05496.1 putative cytosine-specific methyltransferase [uncultured phage_Deep1-GF2-KM23-C739]
MTTEISGVKLLELLPKQNRNGLLEKMLKALLTSPKVKSCSRYKKIWKPKVSKSNVLLFQLAVSAHGIKGKEFGLLPTPRGCEMEGGVVKNVELKNGSFSRVNKKGVRFGVKLKDAVHKMYPTPNATNINTPQSDRVEMNKSGGFLLRKKNKPHMTYGARLQDVMEYLKKPKVGGKLNPNFVEFLMAYPMNWTKIE